MMPESNKKAPSPTGRRFCSILLFEPILDAGFVDKASIERPFLAQRVAADYIDDIVVAAIAEALRFRLDLVVNFYQTAAVLGKAFGQIS